MPDTMVGVVMVLLTESLFAYVMYEYFKIFFEKKNLKGIFLYIYFISVFVQFALRYVPNNMAYIRLITTILFLFTISFFYIGGMGEKIVFSLLFAAMSMFGEAM